MRNLRKGLAAKLALLGAATIGLSGCYYDMGMGYYDDAYSNYYDCDPYSPFDSYYDCDYGYGFYNIGYGGGWYDSYWYPGYGMFVFDNYGRRYNMRDHDRRYWGERRHQWYREHRGRNGGGHGWNGNNSGDGHHGGYDRPRRRDGDGRHNGGWQQNGNAAPPAYGNGSPPANGEWRGRRNGERRSEGRGSGRRNWTLGDNDGSNAAPVPNAAPQPSPGRGGGRGWRNPDNMGGAVPAPRPSGGYGDGRGMRGQPGGGGNYAPPAAAPRQAAPAPVAAPPPPPPAPARQSAPNGGGNRGHGGGHMREN